MSTGLQNPITQPATDPIDFYDLLPGDQSAVDLAPQSSVIWGDLFTCLVESTLPQIEQSQLDRFAIYLLQTLGRETPHTQLRMLADHFSHLYIQALRERSDDLLKKMSLQRLNFFLRSILDADLATEPAAEVVQLEYPCPWDWVTLGETTIHVVSKQPNVIVQQADKLIEQHLGLPTQIDPIDDNLFSLGSFYTDGGYRLSSEQAEFVSHESPILLQFRCEEMDCFLDARGRICDLSTRTIRSLAPTLNVTRARRFHNRLYVMDWTVASTIHTYDLAEKCWQTCSIPDVLLPNDLLRLDDDLYVIDKQQGFIFKFDPEFRLVDKKCGFGRGPGRLFDPIAIHASHDGAQLEVMNWVPANITSVPRF